MIPISRAATILLLLATSFAGIGERPPAGVTHWRLVWHDEFDGPEGSSPSADRWTPETGGSGWGNHELETYTARPQNAHLSNGHLIISALQEDFTGPDGKPRHYTSGRLTTHHRFEQKFGRIEASIKLPEGQGLWSAFWMLGADIDTVKWPQCGEIDIMENLGKQPDKIHGSLHGPSYSAAAALTKSYALPNGEKLSDKFHLFGVEWSPDSIRFFIDNTLYETQLRDSLPLPRRWVFDHPFFLLLNLAVGGDWPGAPDATTKFPAQMEVDYVRVYDPVEASK